MYNIPLIGETLLARRKKELIINPIIIKKMICRGLPICKAAPPCYPNNEL
jgi:hypothetical protein